jgi:poly-gamma-glutamate synthesis protein (capsule biosynthesis protein)
MVFGGDVMLGRAVRDQIVKKGSNNGAWATSKIANVFRNADLSFVNLESPFAPGSALGYSLVFRADPKHVTALTSAGIDVISFANNHSHNQGDLGIRTTLELLKPKKISVAGAGVNAATAYASTGLKAGDLPVAVLAYTYNEKISNNLKRPTIASMDIGRMQSAVRKAKTSGRFVVVSMHAGTEYTLNRTAQQTRFAHAAIDAGADLVVGHHPHWVQPVEKYKGKLILYSLGNLVFDQPWSLATQQGAVARITVNDGKEAKLELLPVKIDSASQPRFMTPAEAKPVLQRMGVKSGIIELK